MSEAFDSWSGHDPGAALDRARTRVRIGAIWVDPVTCEEALDEIEDLISCGDGGAIYTPNVDHVVVAGRDPAFAAAYGRARLALPDGQALVWSFRLLGERLPERVSGADLLMPLMERAAACRWRVYVLGGAPGVAEEAMTAIRERHDVQFVGHHAPPVSVAPEPEEEAAIVWRLRSARPHLVLVALGAPKQEYLIDRIVDEIRPAVAIGVGAAIDFAAGRIRRAPSWVSHAGFEWLYRLCQEPRRLWRRYLVDDRAFVGILYRTMRSPAAERVRHAPEGTRRREAA